MRRTLRSTVLSLLFAAAAALPALAVEPPQKCVQCGMDREKFASSRMVVDYEDGSSSGVCSVHCAAADLAKNPGKKAAGFRVADHGTLELTDARKAAWVTGGKQRGVMTGTPKWAFAKKADAKAFLRENGGRFTTFDKALRASKMEVEEMGR